MGEELMEPAAALTARIRTARQQTVLSHLALAQVIWGSSLPAFPAWGSDCRLWSGSLQNGQTAWMAQAQSLLEQALPLPTPPPLPGMSGPLAISIALEVQQRLSEAIAGATSYLKAPVTAAAEPGPVLWSHGTIRLHHLPGPDPDGPSVLVVPSLVNRTRLVHLLPGFSLIHHLAEQGLHLHLLDWGDLCHPGSPLTLDQAILEGVGGAVTALRRARPGRPVHILGYCMGALLALGWIGRDPLLKAEGSRFVSLAAPWDFHVDGHGGALHQALSEGMMALLPLLNGIGRMPGPLVRALFLRMDPMIGPGKLRSLARLPGGTQAERFIALEDWTNDAVDLPLAVAQVCFGDWYGANTPLHGRWRVAGHPVTPADSPLPSLIVAAQKDKLVPPQSAAALATALPDATLLPVPFGHTGMVASQRAPEALWTALAAFLRARP